MRCMKPSDAIGEPILIVFSDASQDAYAACAYVRWKRQSGQFESNLILSKNRLAPIKKLFIDRIELYGEVLNKRLKAFIKKECRYRFQRIYHIVDSQIVHAMIQKTFLRIQHIRCHKNRRNTRRSKPNRLVLGREQTQYR